MAANVLETEPRRNRVLVVTGWLAATSAFPMPATHSAWLRETMAMAAPGVRVSFKIVSIAACNSGMDLGPVLPLTAAAGSALDRIRSKTSGRRKPFMSGYRLRRIGAFDGSSCDFVTD